MVTFAGNGLQSPCHLVGTPTHAFLLLAVCSRASCPCFESSLPAAFNSKIKTQKKNGSMDEADTHGCISLTAASCYAEDASIFPMFILAGQKSIICSRQRVLDLFCSTVRLMRDLARCYIESSNAFSALCWWW